jgi:hypothetical protein
LHPRLPEEWVSKALRVAMSEADWDRFEALVNRYAATAPTQARAHGQALSNLMRSAASPQADVRPMDWIDWERLKTLRLLPAPAREPEPGPPDWMDWERRKATRLLPANGF